MMCEEPAVRLVYRKSRGSFSSAVKSIADAILLCVDVYTPLQAVVSKEKLQYERLREMRARAREEA